MCVLVISSTARPILIPFYGILEKQGIMNYALFKSVDILHTLGVISPLSLRLPLRLRSVSGKKMNSSISYTERSRSVHLSVENILHKKRDNHNNHLLFLALHHDLCTLTMRCMLMATGVCSTSFRGYYFINFILFLFAHGISRSAG